jgi:hypothetical protein
MSSSRIFWRKNLKPPGKLAAGASSLTRLLEILTLCHNARPWYPLPLGNRHLNFASTSSPLPCSGPGIAAGTKLTFHKRREGRFLLNFFHCQGVAIFYIIKLTFTSLAIYYWAERSCGFFSRLHKGGESRMSTFAQGGRRVCVQNCW